MQEWIIQSFFLTLYFIIMFVVFRVIAKKFIRDFFKEKEILLKIVHKKIDDYKEEIKTLMAENIELASERILELSKEMLDDKIIGVEAKIFDSAMCIDKNIKEVKSNFSVLESYVNEVVEIGRDFFLEESLIDNVKPVKSKKKKKKK